MTDDSPRENAPPDVRALIERIDESWRELLASLDDIPEERLAEPGAAGEWSVKDLFGHTAFWDEQGVVYLDRALAGQPNVEEDWQGMNDTDYAARRDRPLPEQRADMHQAHAALLERLEAIAGLDAKDIDAAIKEATYEHYEEHIPDIRDWRRRIGV